MLEDPLRTPPDARTSNRVAPLGRLGTAPPTARNGLPSLDHRTEQLRLGAQHVLGEPVLTILDGRGLPPRKWPALLALVVAALGAAITPFGGSAPFVFWGTALSSAFLWRQYQEGRFPRRAHQPAGALAITPTRLALVAVRRGWFQTSQEVTTVLAEEPLHPLELHNRLGWGRLDVDAQPLYVDAAKRKATITAVNGLIADVASGAWHAVPFNGAVHVPPPALAAPPPPPPDLDAGERLPAPPSPPGAAADRPAPFT
jgi:hypothetical protein